MVWWRQRIVLEAVSMDNHFRFDIRFLYDVDNCAGDVPDCREIEKADEKNVRWKMGVADGNTSANNYIYVDDDSHLGLALMGGSST